MTAFNNPQNLVTSHKHTFKILAGELAKIYLELPQTRQVSPLSDSQIYGGSALKDEYILAYYSPSFLSNHARVPFLLKSTEDSGYFYFEITDASFCFFWKLSVAS